MKSEELTKLYDEQAESTRDKILADVTADLNGEDVEELLQLYEEKAKAEMRQYETGATRSGLSDKLQYEGYFSPAVLRRRAQYMRKHQTQEDGKQRDADNWQKGISMDDYMDSAFRHFMDVWLFHRGYGIEDIEESICALLFNMDGYLFELLNE